MKNVTSIILILVLICTLVSLMSVPAFAEEGAATPGEESTEVTPPAQDESAAEEGGFIDGLLEKVKGFVTAEKLASLKEQLFALPEKLVSFVKNAATYENIATLIVAIAAIITIPIIFGLVIVAYITIGAMILFAGALTAVVEIILTILTGLIVL